MTSLQKATSNADMAAASPATTTNINGTPSHREFIQVIYHLIQCSQTHVSVLSKLSLLFVCIPYILWGNYSGDAYPPYPTDPGIMPNVMKENITTPTSKKKKIDTEKTEKLEASNKIVDTTRSNKTDKVKSIDK